jgi:transposase-like protein
VRKPRVGRYSMKFRREVVERMKTCQNITGLAEELGLERRLLYDWKSQLEPRTAGKAAPRLRETALNREVKRLQRALAEKTLEVDFFKGALQKIEARRHRSVDSGAVASTTKSGK